MPRDHGATALHLQARGATAPDLQTDVWITAAGSSAAAARRRPLNFAAVLPPAQEQQ